MNVDFDTAILGAGPAGTGPLVCAIQRGDHERLLGQGVLWVDRADTMAAGTLGTNDIMSDTASSVLLECLQGQHDGPLRGLLDCPETHAVRAYGSAALPLPTAGRFLAALGMQLRRIVEASGRSRFQGGTDVVGVERVPAGYVVHLQSAAGPSHVSARRIVFAMGGFQDRQRVLQRPLAGALTLQAGYDHKTLTSSELMDAARQQALGERLRSSMRPRLAIVGGSHSAATAAWLALHRFGVDFDEGAIQILCRRAPKIFYASRDDARADGYLEWTERDVCPVTGRVFRLAGLRLGARELMRSVRGLGHAEPETRVQLQTYDPARDEARVRSVLDDADVIVAALGYRPRTVPLFQQGGRLHLRAELGEREPLVDGHCRLLDDASRPIDGAYGIGLASGFVPHGPLGGEPSFDGQTNGLWLYQNGVGEIVLDHLLGTGRRDQAG